MILAEIESYFLTRKRAGLMDLSIHLGVDPEALRGMLRVLERKGRVRRIPAGTACGGGCTKCAPETLVIFEWTEERSNLTEIRGRSPSS